MKCHRVIVFGLICLAGTVSGCSQPKTRHDQLSRSASAAPPVDSRVDHYEWAKRLMVTPVDEAIQQVNANPGATATMPVPVPQHVAASGIRFALMVDHQSKLAWLQSYGGSSGSAGEVHGPWKLDQPDVAHLLHSLTKPPTDAGGKS